MKILLVYPKYPDTFWSFRHALNFISKKADGPPLGLLTVAALLPREWEIDFIDMNVSHLHDRQIRRADYVFLSGMNIQVESFREVIARCNRLGVKIVAGGPLATCDPQEFPGVDHFVLNEAEITLPLFIEDLKNGNAKPVYTTDEFPNIALTPSPMWDLVNMKDYASMYVQYSRGCPFNCEFCSITLLNGHRPRTKSREQFLGEMEALYQRGWRNGIFLVDDNFIGNKEKLKREILPSLIAWQEHHNYPFEFTTEVSVNLADDEELIQLMVKAGFNSVFTGIETPNDESLAECGKFQNLRRDLAESVRTLQNHGLRVSAGFIVGFDHDPPNIFERQISFIQNSGIVTAMVAVLNAPSGTRLFQRLKSENRLLGIAIGDSLVDGSINFSPKMDYQLLLRGHREVLETIYSQKNYYERVKAFLSEYPSPLRRKQKIRFVDLQALLKMTWKLGIREDGKRYYWKLFLMSIFKHPDKVPLAMRMAAYGYHFRRIVFAARQAANAVVSL